MLSTYLVLMLLQPAPTFAGPKGFDFFLGEWQAQQKWLQDDLSHKAFTNRVLVTKMLQGYGIKDDNFQPNENGEVYFGTAMRIYDPVEGRWLCRWFDGRKQKLSGEFVLKGDGDGFSGEVTGQDHHGEYRDFIRFFNITADKFQWKMIRRYEGLGRDLVIGEITYTRVL